MDVAAAGSRRETPDGHDLDALREEIADDDPDDVLIATAELAGAEQALLVSAADPELGAQIEALTGPIEDLGADLAEAGDPDG